jgi:hypothetical protein
MIRELERETQERLKNAYEALKLPDPDGYTGTAEREYQKELARNLQKDGGKAANASTDQRIAGKLKVAGYSLDEIQKVIEQYSPMAVKPTQEQRQAYAKAVIQKAYFPGSANTEKQLEERRLEQLGIDTKVKAKQSLTQQSKDEEFKFIFSDPDYSLCEYHGRIIHLPKDIAVENDDSPISIFIVSQATYQDTQESLQPSDAANLELYLTDQALKDGIDIILE